MTASPPPFLRIPPFPRGRPHIGAGSVTVVPDQAELLASDIVRLRIGGAFWHPQPALPPDRDLILVPTSRAMALQMADAAQGGGLTARAVALAPSAWFAKTTIPCVDPCADPWHIVARNGTIWAGGNDDLVLIAALSGRELRVFGEGRFAALGDADRTTIVKCLVDVLTEVPLANPFTGAPWDLAAAIAQLGDWRALIEQNRAPKAIYGIARWKRVTMDALLWDGTARIRYAGSQMASRHAAGDNILAWTSRVPGPVIADFIRRGAHIGEVEDGMIRSQGLGANCVPPLSVIIDPIGVHFDPTRPSLLESILAETDFAPAMLARAAALRRRLVVAGLSKYGATPPTTPEALSAEPVKQRKVLVPGQVEDDRSVLTGGGGMTNLALLARARALEPDALIIYRPHPDVEAGHRKGRLAEADVLALADVIERSGAVTAAIDAADELHVITSLAGFEALMRGKRVVTHGVPFYAGWGLTEDHGPVPERRGRPRSIDELVAAVLILYPRYLDPVTRLPCPVEVLVERLAAGQAHISSPLITLRTWQGALARLANRFGTNPK